MLFRFGNSCKSNYVVSRKIKKDLISAFRKKGICIKKIDIDMRSDRLNLQVLMGEI